MTSQNDRNKGKEKIYDNVIKFDIVEKRIKVLSELIKKKSYALCLNL